MADEQPAELNAYDLLSKPTLDLSDAEADKIIADLRQRRKAYISTGKVDKQPKPKAPPGPKADAEEKKRNTALLMAQLKIPGMEKKS